MTTTAARSVVLGIVSLAGWHIVCRTAGVTEAWDAPAYWRLWYPLSLALSAIAGAALARRGWAAGAIVTFAQLPVMWWSSAPADATWPLGLIIASLLAVPAVAISALTGWLAARSRPA